MPQITSRLVDDPKRARIHLVAMGDLKPESLRKYVNFHRLSDKFIGRGLAVCFRPTGWTFSGAPVRRQVRAADNAVVFQLPYSEHSSFEELRRFVQWVKPCRLIPMVGAYTAEKRQQMSTLLAHKDRPLSQAAYVPPT
ncbi:DNA cross-link repair 1A protein isoform X1 [Gracilaria domingensis]|nr:DNA cross-link repair 1A protein isoform X1 [Gracilaria domingensis]